MEEQKKECLLQRKFRCLKIVWRIENSFCVTYQNKWEICSPEFSVNGFPAIKWRFILKASKVGCDGKYIGAIYLERPETGDITVPVRVLWNLSCSSERENIIISEKEGMFDAKGIISSRISNFDRIQKQLQDISTRKFTIEAIFFVTSLDDNVVCERSNDTGLKSLSQDLGVLYNLKDYHDLTVNTRNTSVEGHKAILSAANKLLNDIINQYSGSDEIYLAYSDEKSAGKVFSYLYTGNLDYVLRMPSISLDEAISFFGVKELDEYYMKDELLLSTRYEVREFYYKWITTDIKSVEETSLFSRNFCDRDLNITFRLRLGLKEVKIPGGRISIFLEGSFPKQCQELYIRFDIINIFGDSINLKKTVRWSLEHNDPPGIEDFVSSDIFNDISIAGNNTLSIICSLFIPADSTSLSVLRNRSYLQSNINVQDHYTLFSKRIESLFDTGKYSDLAVRCGNKDFQVHKCILSARSQVLARAIRTLEEDSNKFSINDVDLNIMEVVLRYVYSGILKNYDLADMHKIYAAAVDLGLLTLKNQSTKILEENLDISNIFDTLFLAYTHKEVKLKLEAFKFLMSNKSEIREQDKWKKFTNEKDLYKEFKEYVRIHVRNNPESGLKLDDF